MQSAIRDQRIQDAQRIKEQLEAGKSIVLAFIDQLSREADCPAMNGCSFDASHTDFDEGKLSLLDAWGRVVMKLGTNKLSDAVSLKTPEVRRALEAKLRSALTSHFSLQYAK
jgi:hypothetical protein